MKDTPEQINNQVQHDQQLKQMRQLLTLAAKDYRKFSELFPNDWHKSAVLEGRAIDIEKLLTEIK